MLAVKISQQSTKPGRISISKPQNTRRLVRIQEEEQQEEDLQTRNANSPFFQSHQEILATLLRLVDETRDAEPRGLRVVFGAVRGAEDVADDAEAGAVDEFGVGAKAAYKGHAGEVGWTGG